MPVVCHGDSVELSSRLLQQTDDLLPISCLLFQLECRTAAGGYSRVSVNFILQREITGVVSGPSVKI